MTGYPSPAEVMRVLVLSTSHLRQRTCNDWLENRCPWACYPKGEYGWFVYVCDDAIVHADDPATPNELIVILNYARAQGCEWTVRSLPANLNISFSDWSMCCIDLASNAVAVSLDPIPPGSYVTLKARVKDEDGNLEGVAIWTPGGAPIPLI